MLDLLLRALSPQRVVPARIPAKLLQHVPYCQLVGYAGMINLDGKRVMIKHDVPTDGRAVQREGVVRHFVERTHDVCAQSSTRCPRLGSLPRSRIDPVLL